MDPDGNYDPVEGIREWVVGTGGASQYVFTAPIANSETHSTDTLGILKLVLKPDSYDSEFIPEAGKTYTNAGSASGH